MPAITLGINTCFAVKRWSQPDEWARIVAEDLGLSVSQLSADLFPPAVTVGAARQYVEKSRDAAAAAGVEIHSLFTGLGAYAANLLLSEVEDERQAAEDWYRSFIDLTALAGARGTGGHVGALSVRADADPELRARLIADETTRLNRLSEYAAGRLEFLLFENLAVTREYGHSIGEAHQLEQATGSAPVPWVLCLDLGHPAALNTGTTSDDPVAWLNETWQHTPVIQLQQSSRGNDHHGPFTVAENENGLVHRDAVLDAISRWEVPEVFLFLEVIPAHEAEDAQVLRDLVESAEYWREGIRQLPR
jgi:hypothetical protein